MQTRELERAIAGDLDAFAVISAMPPHRLHRLRQEIPHLVLTAAAVSDVLRQLGAGEIAPRQAQRWASFVRRGYIAGREAGATRPIDIEYAPEAEDEIVEAISRLDELGDEVDGSLSGDEIDELLAVLHGATGAVPLPQR